MTYKKSISDFAAKLDRIPAELREMSGVPSDVRKPARSQIGHADSTPKGAVVEPAQSSVTEG